MNQLRELLEQTWEAKPPEALEGPLVAGDNLRIEAAARLLVPGDRLLDLGCGAGSLALLVRSRFREIHGVDLSPRAVAAAQRRGIQARVWDLNESPLPYEDSYFDAVSLLSVIQYVLEPEILLGEIARVLRSGGMCLVGFPNMRTLVRLFRLAVLGRFPRVSDDPGYDGGTVRYFCRGDVEHLLREVQLNPRGAIGAFWPFRVLEREGHRLPILGGVARELFAAEILVLARKVA